MFVFENQLVPPPEISLAHLNPFEWYNKHKIYTKDWKIADIDTFHNDNSFFKPLENEKEERQIFEDSLAKILKEWNNEEKRMKLLETKVSHHHDGT